MNASLTAAGSSRLNASMLAAMAGVAVATSTALAQPAGGGGGGGGGLDVVIWVIVAIVALVGFFIFIFLLQFLSLYVQALTSNASVGLLDMVGMKLRKVDIRTVVINRIRAVKSGMDIPTNALETHYLAGGRVSNVVSALIAARGAKIELPWATATAIDLAGRDILEAVHTSVNPKVIDCPAPSSPRPTIDAVAKNGIQLKAKARVTVRTNISRLVGGATEETIIARVGQGIVSTIGSAEDHKHVLENPDEISRTVMRSGLDAGTAYEILSIDIATSTWARTSVRSCRPIRPSRTSRWRRQKLKSVVRWLLQKSRSSRLRSRRTGHWSCWQRPKFPRPWPMPSATATWASWTTTA